MIIYITITITFTIRIIIIIIIYKNKNKTFFLYKSIYIFDILLLLLHLYHHKSLINSDGDLRGGLLTNIDIQMTFFPKDCLCMHMSREHGFGIIGR